MYKLFCIIIKIIEFFVAEKKWNLNINSGLSKKNVMTNHHTIYNPQKNTESSIAKGNDLNEIKKKIEEWSELKIHKEFFYL